MMIERPKELAEDDDQTWMILERPTKTAKDDDLSSVFAADWN